jgi:hypothetical protein
LEPGEAPDRSFGHATATGKLPDIAVFDRRRPREGRSFVSEGTWRDARVGAAAVMAVGLVIAAWVVQGAARAFVDSRATITVTGSARQTIRADRAIWRGTYSAQAVRIEDAYAGLEAGRRTVLAWLADHGFPDTTVIVSQAQTQPLFGRSPSGIPTEQIEGYRLLQTIEIRSGDVDRIDAIARTSTELLRQGVRFESMPPEYLVTRLADLKKEMLAAATRDARERAETMARNAGSRIGRLRSARMGVFQVTRAFSTEISDYGVNDTSSPDKDITSVVTVGFELR